MLVYFIIFGTLIIIIALVFLFLFFQLKHDSRSKDSLKSDKIIRVFEPDNLSPELTEMIDYHRKKGVVRYKFGSDQDGDIN